MDQNREAFIDGKEAFKSGRKRSVNPHKPGTRERAEWLNGWLTERSFVDFGWGKTG